MLGHFGLVRCLVLGAFLDLLEAASEHCVGGKCARDDSDGSILSLLQTRTQPAFERSWWGLHAGGDLQFVHIPKNAGSAVENAALVKGIRWGRTHRYFNASASCWTQNCKGCSLWHMPPHRLPKPNPYTLAKETFCITRHPYDRVLSEYKFRLQYTKPMCSATWLNMWVTQLADDVLAGKDENYDCHAMPQAFYVWGPQGEKTCNNVLRLENLTAAFDELMESRHLPLRSDDLKHLRPGLNNTSGKCCPELTVASLSQQSKDLIYKAYSADFDRLGYKAY